MATVLSGSFNFIRGFNMSTQKEREIWETFKYNRAEHLQQDLRQLQQNLRYRDIDAVDCIELALASQRVADFKEFCKTVDYIFKLGDYYGK